MQSKIYFNNSGTDLANLQYWQYLVKLLTSQIGKEKLKYHVFCHSFFNGERLTQVHLDNSSWAVCALCTCVMAYQDIVDREKVESVVH